MIAEKKPCEGCLSASSTDELFKHLDEVIGEYSEKPGGLIPVLQIAQGLFGYLPENVVKRVSQGLKIPFSEVAGVISFYSFFSTRPRGRHIIRVCLGTACYVRGGKHILDALKKELEVDVGGTTENRLFTLDVARCFGACGLAPTIMIDDEVYQRVKATKIKEILGKYQRPTTAEEKGS